jgi:FixJ family two-component response regulator
MRQECLDVPVLICSGHPGELAMEQVRRWGVTDFIGKPFTPTAFLEKVHEALAAHAGRNPV